MNRLSSRREQLINSYYNMEKVSKLPSVANNNRQQTEPSLLIISCIDSRSIPALLFGLSEGEAFCHSHIGALVPPYNVNWSHGSKAPAIAATLELTLQSGSLSDIIILGHTECRGIKTYLGSSGTDHLKSWMGQIDPAFHDMAPDLCAEELYTRAEKQCIKFSLYNLMTYPSVRSAMSHSLINIEAWIHDVSSHQLLGFDPARDDFLPLKPAGKQESGSHKTSRQI
jgi:carbonic anhydrase